MVLNRQGCSGSTKRNGCNVLDREMGVVKDRCAVGQLLWTETAISGYLDRNGGGAIHVM